MMSFRTNGRGRRPLLLRGMGAVLLTLPLAACDVDELLDLQDPDVANPSTLTDSTALPAFRAAAIGEFTVGYAGDGGDNQINYSGMLADEWINSETFPTRVQIDIRRMQEDNSNIQAATRRWYRARRNALQAVDAYRTFSPNNIGMAESFNLLAANYMLFGENYCSGVPFSTQNPDGSFTFGGQNNTTQIFNLALEAADSALAVATRAVTSAANRNAQLNFARVLRGRALLNLNQPAAAAAAVAAVPTNYQYAVFHSENTAREQNNIFTFNSLNERVSMANREGGSFNDYRSAFTAGDWRTPFTVAADGLGFDGITPQFNQQKYRSRSDTTPVATGVEARLIEAEAQLRAGNYGGAGGTLAILNALRATPPTTGVSLTGPALPALAPAATAPEQEFQFFRERAFWLWLTSHRLGDMRRQVRQYGHPTNTTFDATGAVVIQGVFPSGNYHKSTFGGQYGPDVNLPLSVDERNNPEFADFPTTQSLCLDRNA